MNRLDAASISLFEIRLSWSDTGEDGRTPSTLTAHFDGSAESGRKESAVCSQDGCATYGAVPDFAKRFGIISSPNELYRILSNWQFRYKQRRQEAASLFSIRQVEGGLSSPPALTLAGLENPASIIVFSSLCLGVLCGSSFSCVFPLFISIFSGPLSKLPAGIRPRTA